MLSSEVQNMGMTNYPIIYLDLAAYVIGKIGNNLVYVFITNY